jgi:outer membrane receptor protein involved in Fe transport
MMNTFAARKIALIELFLVLSTAIFANDMYANEAPAETISTGTIIDTIVVTGRRSEQPSTHLIGAVGQVSAEEMNRIAHAHISQAAARIPGVWLSRGNGQELLASVRSPVFTGAGSCAEILTTENGLPIRPTGMCNVNQLFEVNTEQASGLEVWRGPGTVFYGSNAMHGVINVLSPVMEKNVIGVELGSHDYRRIKLGWQSNTKGQQFQIVANGVSDGGFKDQSGFDQQKLSVTHRWNGTNVKAKTLLSAVNLNQETAGYIKGFNSYKDNALWKTNPNPEAFRDASAVRLSTQFDKQLETDADVSRLMVRPYVRRSTMTFLQHYLPGQPLEKNGQTSAGVQTQYSFSAQTAQFWLGFDGEWADMFVEERQENPLGSADNVRFQGQHYDFDVTSQQYGLFANSEWTLTDKISLEAGLRYESLKYDYDNNMIDGSTRDDGSACNSSSGTCRYFRPSDRSDTTGNLNYQLGANYEVNANANVYTRIASAFRAPQINELYRLQKEQSIEQVKAEQVDSLEVGINFESQGWALQLSLYAMSKDNVIVKDSNSFVVNDGKTRHQGIEWRSKYTLNDNWQLTTSGTWAKHTYDYTRLYGDIDINGNDVDTAPRRQGSVQLHYQQDRHSLELEWVYLGEYFLDPQNNHEYPGHNLVNIRADRTLGLWNLSAQLTNLTDRRIADRADYAFGSYRYFVGEGRGILLGVKRQF